ncbi:diacylglycerol kinase [Streptomyces antibioticus]|uniref:Diacylglycerol kinase n=1 Tax=Streptomyces antibioticus TaxID=1890 RepID=A0AAE6YA55_STRAT|nr:diacylglycerol kinase [Streptomyces antibioticus]OOQ50330.1 diacylglycerol kinase [Streptomyces antibioticus]QIT45751.1 diacylglycerol kinase [Streptomyces antibioticus]
MATFATPDQLLVIIDPVARSTDGESVRIAKDVLGAGAASTKVCLPESPEEFARMLQRRGSRRPVLIGDDRALVRTVALLHRRRELAGCVLSVVPVGPVLGVAHALGVPTGAVAAARAVLDGTERRLDVLVDDSDGVVLGALRIPPLPAESSAADPSGAGSSGAPSSGGGPHGRPWLHSLVRTLAHSRTARPSRLAAAPPSPGPARLRVEVDGETLVDLDQPVEAVSVTPGASGTAEVVVRPLSLGADAAPIEARGRTVTVSGADFRYRADASVAGPVRRRTWTVREGALGLMLPER